MHNADNACACINYAIDTLDYAHYSLCIRYGTHVHGKYIRTNAAPISNDDPFQTVRRKAEPSAGCNFHLVRYVIDEIVLSMVPWY